jgi:hypothetical protein
VAEQADTLASSSYCTSLLVSERLDARVNTTAAQLRSVFVLVGDGGNPFSSGLGE